MSAKKQAPKVPTTILAMTTLFALATASGSAKEVQDRIERATGARPSDGAYFAALKGLHLGGLTTKTDAKRPIYTITPIGRRVARDLYRQVVESAPRQWATALQNVPGSGGDAPP